MNIFDGIDPEVLKQLLSINQGDNGLDLTVEGQSPTPSLWNSSIIENDISQIFEEPLIPEIPKIPGSSKYGDVSGFANYGMEAPGLPDPIKQMHGLMGMMGDPNKNKKEAQTMPKSALMAYLQSLGV
jgi:hypothetical protein